MVFSMGIIICTLIFSISIAIIYFSKKKINSFETKIYKILSILSILNVMIEFWLCINILIDVKLYGYYNLFVNRTFLLALFSWFSMFTLYLIVISFQNNTKTINKLKNKYGQNFGKKLIYTICPILIICIFLIIFLPIELVKENGAAYSTGLSVNVLYLYAIVYLFIWIICVIINFKNVHIKKFIPFISFIICFSIILIARNYYPALLLNSFSVAFATTLMFHTIENPDIKLINELNENKILVEKTNEEKSKILFKMIQEVKNPVSYIYNVSESLENEDNSEKLKKGIGVINSSARKLSYIINNVLDVSGMDAKRVKVINNKYNIYTLLDEIKVRLEKRRKANVEYRVNISNNIPETLYGDPIKVKQILATILSNAIEHTDSGFIELTIDALVRYDMCRLIITIEDSGVGMNLVKVNEILRFDEELSSEDEEKLQNRYLDLKLVKKMLKFLGGTMMIKSEVGKGSEFIVVLDQKIENPKNDNYSQRYNSTSLFETKRVLIVDDDMEELENIANKFKKDNIDVTTTLYGKDCVDKINSKENYDLILIDDEMPDLSGLGTLKELQKIEGFKIPTVIMLNNDKLRIKDSYLEDGFKDYLLKEKIRSESERLIDKYL